MRECTGRESVYWEREGVQGDARVADAGFALHKSPQTWVQDPRLSKDMRRTQTRACAPRHVNTRMHGSRYTNIKNAKIAFKELLERGVTRKGIAWTRGERRV